MFEVEIKFEILRGCEEDIKKILLDKGVLKTLKGKEKQVETIYLDSNKLFLKDNKVAIRYRKTGKEEGPRLEFKGDSKSEGNLFQRIELSMLLDKDTSYTNISYDHVNKLFKDGFEGQKIGTNIVYEDILNHIKLNSLTPLFTIKMNREVFLIEVGTSKMELSIDRCHVERDERDFDFTELEVELVDGVESDLKALKEELSSIEHLKEIEKSKFQRCLEILN